MQPFGTCRCGGEGECEWCRLLPLREWMDESGTTGVALSRLLDIDPETLSRYLYGALRPSKVTRLAIEHVTQGAMKHDAWPESEP